MVIIGVYSAYSASEIIEAQVSKTSQDVLVQVGQNIGYRLTEIQNLTDNLSISKPFRDSLTSSLRPGRSLSDQYDDFKRLNSFLTPFETNPNLHGIRLFIPNPGLSDRKSIMDLRDLQDFEDFEKAQQQGSFWKKTYTLTDSLKRSVRLFSLVQILRSPSRFQDIQAILMVDISEELILDLLRGSSSFQQGIVSVSGPEGPVAQAQLGNTQLPAVPNGRSLVLDQSIPNSLGAWSIRLEVPISEVSGRSAEIRSRVLLLAALCTLMYILAAAALSTSITRGLGALDSRMQQMGKGDYRPIETVYGNDEIANLQRSFNRMAGEIQWLIETNYENTILRQQAEFKALEGQINPHFLYNTLDTARWMARRSGHAELTTLLDAFSDFFRLSLNAGQEETNLGQELNHVQSYVQIQNIRFKNAVALEVSVAPEFLTLPMLKLILQPLVENAILHGFSPKKPARGTIRIRAYQETDNLILEVADDGVGIEPDRMHSLLDSESQGYGLKNIHQRIRLYHGEPFGLSLRAEVGGGTCVIIRLPWLTTLKKS